MNIRLDQNGITKTVDEIENKYVSYGRDFANKSAKANTDASVSVEFGGILSDNGMNAYADNKSLEARKNNNLSNELAKKDQKKNYQILMSETVSKDELGRLAKDGFEVEKLDPKEVVTITDKIKATMANSGVVIEGYNDDLDIEALESVAGSKVRAYEVDKEASKKEASKKEVVDEALERYDLPKTDKNWQEIMDKADRATSVEPVSSSAMKYLIKNNLEPTFENIYKANHLGGDTAKNIEGYYNDAGFLDKKADMADVSNIMEDVDNIIKLAGYEITDDRRIDALWIIENGIELTEKSFSKLENIKALPLPATYEQAANAICAAIKNTADAANAVPGEYKSLERKALDKIGELDELITREDISRIRELNEARLFMSVRNTSFLIKNGIDIDFSDLKELVENLKEAENVSNQIIFGRGDYVSNKEAEDLFDLTNEVVKELPSLPAKTVGIFINKDITLRSFYTEAKVQQAWLVDKYEPLMTSVRADLGDSIQEAFRNVDELLRESNIEVTKENEKAVRILGYNALPITNENVEKVREADQKLTRVITKMKPGITLSLIREGINPIDMDIDELEARLNEKGRHLENDVLKYSEFLVKLENANQITSQERDSFIGIYRALYQIEKQDSAALGALLDSQMDMTLSNLLTQARIRNLGRVDVNIDDSYGILDKKIEKGPSITEQILSAFDEALNENQNENINETMEEAKVIKAYDEASLIREYIDDLGQIDNIENALLELGHMKDSIENKLGIKGLVRDRGLILRGLRLVEDKEAKGDEDSAISDAVDRFKEALTDKDSASDAYEQMASKMKSQLETGIYSLKDIHALKDVGAAIGALNVATKLAKNEFYQLPVSIGDSLTSVSIHLIKDSGKTPSVSIYSESLEYGRVSATFTHSQDGLEGIVMSDKLDSLEILERNKSSFIESLSSNQIPIKSIYYTENKNTGLRSLTRDIASDEMAPKADTRDLYMVAKEFLNTLTKLF